LGLPFRDFIFVTEILWFPLSPWLVFGPNPIKPLPVRSFHVVTKTNVTFLVATPRHLFNPPVTGSHASICKVSTVLIRLASLEPNLDFSEPEPRSISEPCGYGYRVGSVLLGMTVQKASAALEARRQLSNGE
jgi:hypothetical protein